jgi:hypothetical protein
MMPPTDLLAPVRRGTRGWWIAAILAAVFLAGHLPFLASTLEDVDSVNFALGLRDFDPGRHRPHPPGYPIYMALGKIANTTLSEPRALAIWARFSVRCRRSRCCGCSGAWTRLTDPQRRRWSA